MQPGFLTAWELPGRELNFIHLPPLYLPSAWHMNEACCLKLGVNGVGVGVGVPSRKWESHTPSDGDYVNCPASVSVRGVQSLSKDGGLETDRSLASPCRLWKETIAWLRARTQQSRDNAGVQKPELKANNGPGSSGNLLPKASMENRACILA